MRWVLGLAAALVIALAGLALAAKLGAFDVPLDRLRAKYAAADSQFVTIDGVQLHVRDSGRPGDPRPVLLLIHGHYQSLRIWDPWVARMPKVRVIRFDMPPYGLSGPDPSGQYGPQRVQVLLGDLIAHEGLHDIALGGASTGSAIALRYAFAHPDQVKKLVLVNAPLEPVPPRLQPKWPWYMNTLEAWVFKPIHHPRFFYSYLLHHLFGDPAKVTPALIDEAYDMHSKPGNAAQLATFTRNLSFKDPAYKGKIASLRGQMAALKTPTLILWGGAGTMLPVSLAEKLNADLAGANAQLIVYPGSGHFLPLEEPQAADDLQRFVIGG